MSLIVNCVFKSRIERKPKRAKADRWERGKKGMKRVVVMPRAAGEKAFIARCTILRVLNSFAGVIPTIGNGSQERRQVLAIL